MMSHQHSSTDLAVAHLDPAWASLHSVAFTT